MNIAAKFALKALVFQGIRHGLPFIRNEYRLHLFERPNVSMEIHGGLPIIRDK